jgi:hypothetical protein
VGVDFDLMDLSIITGVLQVFGLVRWSLITGIVCVVFGFIGVNYHWAASISTINIFPFLLKFSHTIIFCHAFP